MPRANAMRALRDQQQQKREAESYTIPAPIGGLNGRDALANMPETDAVVLDNWFPQASWVEFRRGKSTIATFTAICPTVMAYNALLSASNQLFAGTITVAGTGAIYSVSPFSVTPVVGGVSNIVQAVTNAVYDWTLFGSGSAEVLYALNNADPPLLFDGTTWWPISSTTANISAITKASSAVVTITTVSGSNPFSIGNNVGFLNVVGMTQINGLVGNITATGGSSGAWTFTVNINSSAFSSYVSGGVVNPYVLTGGPASLSSLAYVTRYKSRLWFIQAGTMNVYYLPQNVFAGALTLLPMAANFNNGGSLAMIATNSIDNAAGVNDYIAFVSTLGEVVLFDGYDPSQVSTFFEVGHFQIGRPLANGRRGWAKIGSDAAILSVDGLIPISKALVADRSQPLVAITDKIRDLITNDAQTYGGNQGWQVVFYPIGKKIIINVPIVTNQSSYQYVQNTITGAWCTFGKFNSPWNALAFETMGDNLYYGTVFTAAQADTGTSDDGNAYICTAKPAFSYLGDQQSEKLFTLAQPIFQNQGTITYSVTVFTDFSSTGKVASVPISQGNSAIWNVSLWSAPTFWGDATTTILPWIGINGTGYSISMQIQASVSGLTSKWMSTKYLYRPGGIFYG